MGNAVCPTVASALGRCLALAALGTAPDSLDDAVIPIPDPDFEKVWQHSQLCGITSLAHLTLCSAYCTQSTAQNSPNLWFLSDNFGIEGSSMHAKAYLCKPFLCGCNTCGFCVSCLCKRAYCKRWARSWHECTRTFPSTDQCASF